MKNFAAPEIAMGIGGLKRDKFGEVGQGGREMILCRVSITTGFVGGCILRIELYGTCRVGDCRVVVQRLKIDRVTQNIGTCVVWPQRGGFADISQRQIIIAGKRIGPAAPSIVQRIVRIELDRPGGVSNGLVIACLLYTSRCV